MSEMSAIIVNDTVIDDDDQINSTLGSTNDRSNNNEIKSIEKELEDLQRTQRKGDGDTSKVEILRRFVMNLQEQIADLTLNIEFLRQDSLNKNNIINNLFEIIQKSNNKYYDNNKSIFNNTSTYNDKVSSYNKEISKDNDNVSNENNDRNNNGGNANSNNSNTKNVTNNTKKYSPDVVNGSGTQNMVDNILNDLMSTPVQKEHKAHHYHFFTPMEELRSDDTTDKKESDGFQNIETVSEYFTCKENRESERARDEKTKPHIINSIYSKPLNTKALWKKGTTLIIGDSLLYGLDEQRLKNAKVRIYPGAGIEDMHYNILPLLRKKPTTVILHVGTNDCTSDNSAEITVKLLKLKNFILTTLPTCKIIFSSLIDRFDDANAQLTVKMTNENMEKRELNIIDNSNIIRTHLGKKGLHMNPNGTGRLALNIIKVLKSL